MFVSKNCNDTLHFMEKIKEQKKSNFKIFKVMKSMSKTLGEFTRHVYMYTSVWQGYLFKGYLIIHP